MHKLLIVDDDIELCELLSAYLSGEGFDVTLVHNGLDGVETIRNQKFDLIVLDVMMPEKNGFDVLREVGHFNRTPILMLTAKGDELDRIIGLEMGADDYLSKPCNPRELVARVRSIIRRNEAVPEAIKQQINKLSQTEDSVLTIADVCINGSTRVIKVNQQPLELTATEFEIIYLLLKNAGKLVTREDICEQCLGRKLMSYDRSIDMHISHLRKKLGYEQHQEERIKTIRGIGYQYVAL